MNWRDRIIIDPEIHHGDPCIKGTRVPVSVIAGSLATVTPRSKFSLPTRN